MATYSASPATSYQSWHAHQLLLARELCPDPAMLLGDHRTQYYSASSVVQRLQLERRLESHHGCVNCINFSHGGELLASGSDDLHIVLWDWRKGVSMSRFETGHHSNIFQAKFVPQCNDSVIVSAARDGQVMCHVISTTGEPITSKQVGLHRDSAHKIALEPDNPHVFLSCGEDGSVLEIDLRDNASSRNKLLICRNDRNGRIPLYSIFIDPSDYNRFAISGRDPFARVYDRRTLGGETTSEGNTTTPQPVQKYCPEHLSAPRGSPNSSYSSSNVTCLVYSHDGKELLCTYNDEDIYTFDTTCSQSDSNNIKKFSGHRNNATVKGVNYFGLCSEYVVSGSDCGHVFLWDKRNQEIVQYFEGDKEGVVNCLEPHPQIPVLATSGLDHDVKIFAPSSGVRTDLAGLSEVTSANLENRRIDAERMPDGYDMIMSYIMRQYRRRLRQRLTDEDDEDDSDSDDSGGRMELRGNGADGDGDEEEDDDGEHYVQCRQS